MTSRFDPQVKLWKWLSLFVAIPAVALLTYINLLTHIEHTRPEFKDWDHLRPRMKWPFKDGKHSPFHNKWFNAIHYDAEGYETTDEEFAKEFHLGEHHH